MSEAARVRAEKFAAKVAAEEAAPTSNVVSITSGQPIAAVVDDFPAPLAKEAFHGILGAIAKAVAPLTEADPGAILVQGLTIFGNVASNAAFLELGPKQRANLAMILVGETGRGRKGTSLDIARRPFDLAYPEHSPLWLPGVASGEAIPAHVIRKAPEQRAIMIETEFGRLLKVMGRDGSTLSQTFRAAWDGSAIGVSRSREEEIVAWDAHHISLIGHITPVELRATLTATDQADGFANRLMFFATRRSRLDPFPESPDGAISPYVDELRDAILAAHRYAELKLDAAARDRWEGYYRELDSAPRLGLAGALTARHATQVRRLALIYALADQSPRVTVIHLEAAIAIAEYAKRSVTWAFGDSTGNLHADELRIMLAEDGELSWSEAKAKLGIRLGHVMREAVDTLIAAGYATVEKQAREGGGRATRLIRAAG